MSLLSHCISKPVINPADALACCASIVALLFGGEGGRSCVLKLFVSQSGLDRFLRDRHRTSEYAPCDIFAPLQRLGLSSTSSKSSTGEQISGQLYPSFSIICFGTMSLGLLVLFSDRRSSQKLSPISIRNGKSKIHPID